MEVLFGPRMLKARQKLGKYRIVRRIADGGFATVYDAYDTIENQHVALKVPHTEKLNPDELKDLYREVRLTASLRHPSILSIKNAEHIGDQFVIAYPLGVESLADRLSRRLGARQALTYAEQLLSAVAFAHKNHVIHCDIKPENVVVLEDKQVALTDFGIAKVALRTRAVTSAGGTLGYMAPEHALGKPSYRSDVFSLGLVLWKIFSGRLPEWPFEAPLDGYERLRRLYSAEFIQMLMRALLVDQRQRYADAGGFNNAFLRVKRRALRGAERSTPPKSNGDVPTWKLQREKEFRRRFSKHLKGSTSCPRCHSVMAEAMTYCPWCGTKPGRYRGTSAYSRRCGRCGRGIKGDWKYCTWCRGTLTPTSVRTYPDKRYVAHCERCGDKSLVQFSRCCPRCRHRVTRDWTITQSRERCDHCNWGVLSGFWNYCPWCNRTLPKT